VVIRRISKGRGSTHVRTNRDILGESDARHCQRPGTGQKRGCIMISVRLPVDAAGGSPLTEPSVPTRDPDSPWDKLELF